MQLADVAWRKALAWQCETVIAQGLSAALSGRLGEIHRDDPAESRNPETGWPQLPEWPAFTGA